MPVVVAAVNFVAQPLARTDGMRRPKAAPRAATQADVPPVPEDEAAQLAHFMEMRRHGGAGGCRAA